MIRFDNLPPEVQLAMCTPMNRILSPKPFPNDPSHSSGALFIGSLAAVYERDQLDEQHITHIVQVLDVPWLPLSQDDGIDCYRIDIIDRSKTDIRPHLVDVCAHIDHVLKNGDNVLVHCQQGVSRSAAVVIAYLIRNCDMSYDEAFDLVKRERACIKPNAGFVRALKEWENQWHPQSLARRRSSE